MRWLFSRRRKVSKVRLCIVKNQMVTDSCASLKKQCHSEQWATANGSEAKQSYRTKVRELIECVSFVTLRLLAGGLSRFAVCAVAYFFLWFPLTFLDVTQRCWSLDIPSVIWGPSLRFRTCHHFVQAWLPSIGGNSNKTSPKKILPPWNLSAL